MSVGVAGLSIREQLLDKAAENLERINGGAPYHNDFVGRVHRDDYDEEEAGGAPEIIFVENEDGEADEPISSNCNEHRTASVSMLIYVPRNFDKTASAQANEILADLELALVAGGRDQQGGFATMTRLGPWVPFTAPDAPIVSAVMACEFDYVHDREDPHNAT